VTESIIKTTMLETKKCLVKFCVCSVWLQIRQTEIVKLPAHLI